MSAGKQWLASFSDTLRYLRTRSENILMPDVLHPKKFPIAATMMAAAIGAFVLMQAT
ncbi:ribonuclease, partial [Rhizobium ruizarguesonis]